MTQGEASEDESSRGDPALIGRTVAGKYKIEKFLGGGAMGAVYKARQSSLEKNVALKVMHRAIAVDPNYVGRFHREAKAASRLDHPNSMRVIDFGEEPDGLLYIAMEYVEGRDLYRVMHDDWPISNADLADILMQALAAIAVAHEMGVIHRDLKPENLMILRAKNDEEKDAYLVKVCDFGIAKITEADEESSNTGKPGHKLTTQGLVVGTPEYMSPEQARGEKLDARSDIYAMGIILYQLLTGRTPFVADTALAVVLKHITEPPEPPATHYAGVHKGLEAVCMRALAKDRNDRFQTARAMRSAIREALDGRPQPANDPAAPTAAGLVGPSASLPVAAVESAFTVAGGMSARHLTQHGTAAAAPEPRRSRVGVVLAVVALLGLGAAVAVAAPRLIAKSRTDRVAVEPTGHACRAADPAALGLGHAREGQRGADRRARAERLEGAEARASRAVGAWHRAREPDRHVEGRRRARPASGHADRRAAASSGSRVQPADLPRLDRRRTDERRGEPARPHHERNRCRVDVVRAARAEGAARRADQRGRAHDVQRQPRVQGRQLPRVSAASRVVHRVEHAAHGVGEFSRRGRHGRSDIQRADHRRLRVNPRRPTLDELA